MLKFHRRVIAMHKAHRVLSRGSLKFLMGDYNCLAYGRFDSSEKLIVVFNNNSEEKELEVKVWPAEVGQRQPMMQIFATDAESFTEERRVYPVERGILKLKMPATSACVLKAVTPEDEAEMALEEAKRREEAAAKKMESDPGEKQPEEATAAEEGSGEKQAETDAVSAAETE